MSAASAAAPASALIRLAEVHKSYRDGSVDNHVLRGLSLSIDKGEMVAITGPSGSGKSTLLNIIGGLDQRYRGEVEIAGQRVMDLTDRALSRYRNRTVGFIFQQFHLLPHLEVVDNVCLPSWFAREAGTSRRALRDAATRVLERVGIGHKAGARPNHLSGGERQRVAIARALFNRPAILLCDEPTGALDSVTTETVFALIADLNRQEGLTVLVVTHERDIARRCPRRVHLADGQIASDERDPAAPLAGDERDPAAPFARDERDPAAPFAGDERDPAAPLARDERDPAAPFAGDERDVGGAG